MYNSIEIEVKEIEEVVVEDKREVLVKELVRPPRLQEKSHVPTIQGGVVEADKEFEGLSKVTVEPIETEELNILPNTEEQVKEGLFNKVTVAGSENLVAENIRKGVEIFGVKGTGNITDVKITNASYLFYNGNRLDCIDELLELCENVTSTASMFYGAKDLTELDLTGLDTSHVTNMGYMFSNCNNLRVLDISNFDTSKVTAMNSMFNSCTYLKELNLTHFDTSQVTNMSGMFGGSTSSMTSLDVSSFDTRNVTNVSSMFSVGKLPSLDLSNFDLSKVDTVNDFLNAGNLTYLKSFKNLGKAYTRKTQDYGSCKLRLALCTKLPRECLVDVLTNGLYDLNLSYDVANGGTLYSQTLDLGSKNIAKLTEEEIAIATSKGWNVI